MLQRFLDVLATEVEPQERKPYVPEINVGKMSEIPTGSESEDKE